jgi:MYND finger
LIPLLAVTAATATSCLAYFYLQKETKKKSVITEDGKPLASGTSEKESTTSGPSNNVTLKSPQDDVVIAASALLQHKEEASSPSLTEVSYEEETSSGDSTPHRVGSPTTTINDSALADETPKPEVTDFRQVEITIMDASVDGTVVATTTMESLFIENNKVINHETAVVERVAGNTKDDKATKRPTDGPGVPHPGTDNNEREPLSQDPSVEISSGVDPTTRLDQAKDGSQEEGAASKQKDGTEKSMEPDAPEAALTVPNTIAETSDGSLANAEPLTNETGSEATQNARTLSPVEQQSEPANTSGETVEYTGTTTEDYTGDHPSAIDVPTSPEKDSSSSSDDGNMTAIPVPPAAATSEQEGVEINEMDLWQFLQKEMQQTRRCDGCNTDEGNKKFKPCAKCRVVFYCDRACQKKAWKQHKKVCCK